MTKTHLSEERAPAVERALDVLELVTRSNRGLTVTELSRKLAIPYSSTHYILFTLLARGYVERIPGSHRYSLGTRAFNFAPLGIAELQLRHVFSPHLHALAKKSGMRIQAAVRKGDEGMIVDRIDPPWQRQGGVWAGHHFDLHCTALGKVLTAWLSDREMERLFANRTLIRFTARTICDFKTLKANLSEVRNTGFAVNDGEFDLESRGVAAPVFGRFGLVIAAVSAGGSTAEIPTEQMQTLADEILRTTQAISAEILVD